jgi:putative peptide zinc metalloprotease protein
VNRAAVTGRIAFHPLSIRAQGDSWVIGRVETGEFAAMPAVAHRTITLLAGGRTVEETAAILRRETGTDFAVADFVAALDDMGFVAAVDGQAHAGFDPPRPTMPWLRPRHVRWTLHPGTAWLALALITAAAVMMICVPALVPRYHDLVWSTHAGIVLAVNAALGWALIWLHELGHLITARGAGVPSRMSLSTRLQFLAAQTDVSGVWAAPRRVRWTVYLAGITVNLVIAAGCVLLEPLATPGSLARHVLAATALMSVLFLPLELLIFMRTDLYFLVQDAAGCANLYADGSAHLRHLARRARNGLRRGGPASRDPALALPRTERRAVRAYSWLLLAGTAASIAMAVVVTIPATVVLVAHAVGELGGRKPVDKLDGLAAVLVLVGFQFLWLRTWWRRHGGQVRGYLRPRSQRSAGGGDLNAAHGGQGTG